MQGILKHEGHDGFSVSVTVSEESKIVCVCLSILFEHIVTPAACRAVHRVLCITNE